MLRERRVAKTHTRIVKDADVPAVAAVVGTPRTVLCEAHRDPKEEIKTHSVRDTQPECIETENHHQEMGKMIPREAQHQGEDSVIQLVLCSEEKECQRGLF